MAETSVSPRSDLPATVVVGRILRAHGVRGEVSVELSSDVPDRFRPGASLLLRAAGGEPRRVTLASCRAYRGGALLAFEGFEGREAVEDLRGAVLEIERERVPPAEPGTYYHFQLLGCRCAADGEELGEVVDLLEDGGGLLLVVDDGDRKVPIPFVGSFLKEVDVERGRIELALPEGLLEACASKS